MTPPVLSALQFQPNEPENVRRSKLQRILDHLVALEAAALTLSNLTRLRTARQVVAGRYFQSSAYSFVGSTVTKTLTGGTLCAVPFETLIEADGIAFEVTTAVAASNARVGIYSINAKGGIGSLLIDAGSVATATAGIKVLAFAATYIRQPVWLVIVSDAAITLRAASASAAVVGPLIGLPALITNNTNADYGGYLTVTQAYGALPSTLAGTPTWANDVAAIPCMSLRGT